MRILAVPDHRLGFVVAAITALQPDGAQLRIRFEFNDMNNGFAAVAQCAATLPAACRVRWIGKNLMWVGGDGFLQFDTIALDGNQ